MKPKVYLETSVISYLAARPSRDVIIAGRQAETHEWWERHRQRFDVYISALVEQEIARGNPEQAVVRQAVVQQVASVAVTEAAIGVARELLEQATVPAGSEDDALHIGIAVTQDSDYLLTWNFKHINNAAIARRIREVIFATGYRAPVICSPGELGGDLYD